MTELSPAAQAVVDALYMEELNGPQQLLALSHAAAALRAVADQVVPKEWPTIEDYNEYQQGFAAAHIKHRNQILAITSELKA
jgi:hypothetical protein